VALSLLTASAVAGQARPAPHRPINPLFAKLLPALRRTGVPLLLPTRATMHTGSADLALARAGYYLIYVGYIPHCDGATACDIGSLEGKRRPASRPRPPGTPVRLARGITGYFTRFTCGASCDESYLRWDYRGYRYTVGLKAGLRPRVVRVANSAIVAGPV
jgi:hypothetical protein